MAEAAAVLTALRIWATSDVMALAAALLSLALEEALMVERVDSGQEVSIRCVSDINGGKHTDVGYWPSDGTIECVDDACWVCLSFFDG